MDANNSPNLQPDKFLRQRAVIELCGLSRTTLWRLEREGLFPARKRLGKRAIGWLASEVTAWIGNRAEAHLRVSNIHAEREGR